MNEAFVYVEGPSDRLGMQTLLADLIEIACKKGNAVHFLSLNGKAPLLSKGPTRATNILRNRPNSYVFLVPDLYPPNVPFPHRTYLELREGLTGRFRDELRRKRCDPSLQDRFFVHCFKFDLEALVLGSEEALLARLGKRHFSKSWTRPVEDQDHLTPPKRIVEALFSDAGMRYRSSADVPWILGRSSRRELIEKCAQNFKPFMEDLFRILDTDPNGTG